MPYYKFSLTLLRFVGKSPEILNIQSPGPMAPQTPE